MLVAALALLVLILLLQLWSWRHPRTEPLAPALQSGLAQSQVDLKAELIRGRHDATAAHRELRQELQTILHDFSNSVQTRVVDLGEMQTTNLRAVASQLDQQQSTTREEIARVVQNLGQGIAERMNDLGRLQQAQLATLTHGLQVLSHANEQRLEGLRLTVERKLSELQADNSQQLEQMRATVDEKLHATLEQRLGDSFKLVSERLEQVHNGLGEMRSLATGVGDLRKVLTNVKIRGSWGEVQLGNLLEQMLTAEQFEKNVCPKPDSGERVEFAVKLPGRDGDGGPVWLPIDAKFPQESYQRLVEAQEQGDAAALEQASAELERNIKKEAEKVATKYICPPHTTDFAILFLPTEGLYAELIRRPGLCEQLQRDHRVMLSGPTTLAALLTSLQMGFRSLAIEQRTSEVWKVLGAVKTEFGKFGLALEKVQKKLQEATNSVDEASRRSRAVQRKLATAEALPAPEAQPILEIPSRIDALDESDSDLPSLV